MAYTVVTGVVEGATEPDPPNLLQLDAPEGSFVVSVYGNLAGGDPDYRLSFLGADAALHPTSVLGSHKLVVDGAGRVTGAVFEGMVGPDVEVGIVCVGD